MTTTATDSVPIQAFYRGKPYVQVTYVSADSEKPRTVWAIKIGDGNYMRAGESGGVWQDPKAPANVVRTEVIVCLPGEATERPAAVNLILGQMEVTTVDDGGYPHGG